MAKALDKIVLMFLNKIKTFYHKNGILRDYVYMVGLFLNLLDTQNEKNKFIKLYDTYSDLLYWIALKKTSCIEDVEECVQETFLYVAKHFDKIGEINSKKTKIYLSTIITGFAIDTYNASQKAEFIEFNGDNETADLKYYESFGRIELLAIVDNALEEESKVFFHLKYLYNYKSKEIAELYNVKDSYVRKKLEYARNKLKKILEERK